MIHLWNVKQGKTIKIGSIALLGESSRASSKSFKINDWLLLLLRCLLLIILVFLLAQPYLKKIISGKNKTGWVLVDKTIFPSVFKSQRNMIDSLLKKGYEIHDFNYGFAQLTLKDTADKGLKEPHPLTHTALLSAANQIVPPGTVVYLFADHRLKHFANELSTVGYNLNWVPLNQTDTLSSWITTYAGKKYRAKSNPSNTTYQALDPEDDTAINVTIHEARGITDGQYLIAALKAIGSFTGRKIIINPEAGKADIGFWLSHDVVSANFKSSIAPDGALFQYEKGKVISEPSFINLNGHHVKLSKRISSTDRNQKIWTDGFGNAILANENTNDLNIYHFYSRFNAQWNELVWDGLFVKAMMPIVIRDKSPADFGFEDNQADQRIFSVNQQGTTRINTVKAPAIITQNRPLASLLWIAALLLFTTERILSFRKKTDYVKN